MEILVEVSPGELLDKITILEIKSARMVDPAKLRSVRTELGLLNCVRGKTLPQLPQLDELTADLKRVNALLWEIEDEIRLCEAGKDFGPRFIELARSIYRHNDRRAAVKRQINDLLGARLIEEKAYASYPL